jgi:hypothetical protein
MREAADIIMPHSCDNLRQRRQGETGLSYTPGITGGVEGSMFVEDASGTAEAGVASMTMAG